VERCAEYQGCSALRDCSVVPACADLRGNRQAGQGGASEPHRQILLQLKDGMNTASATRTGVIQRPLFHRVARKWYSWAGLALTVTASYLAIDGQLRLGSVTQLQASPRANEAAWQAIPPQQPVPAPATVPPTELNLEQLLEAAIATPPTEGPRIPDVIPIPAEKLIPLNGTPVGMVLDSYVTGQPVQPVSNQEVHVPILPPVPVAAPIIVPPQTEPVIEVQALPVQPAPLTVAEPQPVPVPQVQLQPMPQVLPETAVVPAPVPTVLAQNPSTLPMPNPPVGRPVEIIPEGEAIPTRPNLDPQTAEALANEVESLTQNEKLVYEAAQNAAKMKDFPRMVELFDKLLKARPDLLYIRAEYAGLLVTAGELQRAVDQYKRVIELSPDTMLYRIRLGDVYIIGKDYKAAIRMFSDVLRQPPYEPEYAVRLARAYVFDRDFNNAFRVFDQMLAKIRPDDPRAPAAMGALLLDLDMPTEAMPFLLAKRKQLEKDPRRKESQLLEVLGGLIRGYARLGERQAAMDIIAELPTIAVDQIGIRLNLGDELRGIEEYELAAQVYNQVLQLDPNYGPAIIGMARIYLGMSHPAQARQILDSFRPAPRQMRDYLDTYSVYHQRVGEYIEARQIYTDMLRRNENDNSTRVSLGLLFYNYKDEYERSKAEFAKVPPTATEGREARRNFANVLAYQKKFQEALEIDRMMLQEDPSDYLTIAQTTTHYAKAGMFDQAISLARGYLATNPRSEGQAVAVRLALGRALLDAGRYLDSIREYEILISRASGRQVEAYYGLMRAHEKLGNGERARQFAACMSALPGGEFRNRLQLATLYYIDYDDNRAIEICMGLLNQDPKHLPTLLRLADSQQRLSRFSGQPADVFQTGGAILGLSPTNVRGHFAVARSFAVAQNFRKAAGQYDQLIQLDPDQFGPRLERVRCLYADHQYSAARSSYENLQKPSPDDAMMTNIGDLVTRSPKMAAFLQPYVVSGAGGIGLRKELGRLSTTVPDPEVRLAMHRVVCDYDACVARYAAIRLEQDALEVKDYRPFTALNQLQQASEFDRNNTETLFGLGQQFSSLRFTQRAIEAYGGVLNIDPTHRDSMVATERASAEMGPKLDANWGYFQQRGRDRLATIDREKYMVAGRIPLGDELEYLQLGYQHYFYRSPFDYPNTVGYAPFMRLQKRVTDLLLLYGQVNVEEYNNGFDTRPTFDIGAQYQFCEWASARFGGNLENVVENGESIRQDIHRGGIYAGADVRPTRLWAFGGQYNYWHYSDDNDLNAFTLYNELILTLPPKLLKIAQRMYFWGYREGTTFPTDPPDERNIAGAVHPYFSPDAFSQVEMRLEWYHWLSRDYFVHSNQCWYSLQYGIMTDNQLVTYHNLRAMLNYDVCTWLTIGAQADAQLSDPYTMFSAMGYLQIRFR